MKKSFLVISVLSIVISCMVSCTNVIDDKDIVNVEYDLKIDTKESGFIEESLPVKITIISKDINSENKYTFKYEVIEGEGAFINKENKSLPEAEEINLNSNSIDLNYTATVKGTNTIKITTNSTFGVKKEETM